MNTSRSGFTLIEMLMVVVVIGLLAGIAIPKFQAVRERSYLSSVRADLRSLASRQDIYYREHHSYSTSIAALAFASTEGVTVAVGEADSFGWSASASHSALGTGEMCAIYHGSAGQVAPASVASTVQCSGAALP